MGKQIRIGKYKIQYCNGGLQINHYLYGLNSPISQIKWRFNFRRPYGLHRIAK